MGYCLGWFVLDLIECCFVCLAFVGFLVCGLCGFWLWGFGCLLRGLLFLAFCLVLPGYCLCLLVSILLLVALL